METKKGVLVVILLCVFLGFFAEGVNSQEQAKHQVISLLPNEAKPATVTISKGTTVIWINEGKGMVEIRFTNTESMMMTCDSPLGFMRGIEGQFISDKVPFRGVASLCFIKDGEFNYTIERDPSGTAPPADQTREFKGKIIVK